MSVWPMRSIEYLCRKVTSGGTPSRQRPDYFAQTGGHAWVKSAELLDRAIYSTEERISEAGLRNSSAKHLPKNTVVLAMYGANVGQLGILAIEATLNQAICGMVTDEEKCDPHFLFYALKVHRKELIKRAHGAAQQNLSAKLIKRFELPVPALQSQRRIASILSTYDDLIEVNRRRVAVLEEMARELFEEWFVRFRFPGYEAVPLEERPERILPRGWAMGTLGDIAQCTGQSLSPLQSPDETFAHYSLPAFDAGRAPSLDEGSSIMSNKMLIQSPVILVSKLNPRIPRTWFVSEPSAFRQLASTEFVPIEARVGVPLAYVYAIVSGERFRNRLAGMAGGTSTSHQRVKPKDILSTPIALAPAELVASAGDQLAALFRLVEHLEASNRALAASRDLLLPRLISGKLSVETAERELEEAA